MNRATNPRRTLHAVTLLELLISVSLTMLIILALYQMFARTQKAMHGSIVAGDLTENGRACLDMIRREVETLTPAGTPLNPSPFVTNLWIDTATYGTNALRFGGGGPLLNSELHDFFFLGFDPSALATPKNWTAVGYRVADPNNALLPVANGVGTLYRFYTNATRASSNMAFLRDYISPPSMAVTNYFQRVADGVVHLTLRVVTNGVPVAPLGGTNITFTGTNAPSLVELEIGFLESPIFAQARGMPYVTATNYLSSRGNHVHFFRTLIPVRATPQ
ncbi:MAG: hypothetical protein FJ386_05310 [Verrucomicrobia bacterium]|nr:hypothetical protein [Verrucomicrobiota bacterium]